MSSVCYYSELGRRSEQQRIAGTKVRYLRRC